jgi:zinc D-Ala-D-Ala carboxypeptidase
MKQTFFTLKEFLYSKTAGSLGIDNVPDFEQVRNLDNLVKYVLNPCRQYIGTAIYVNSGYRSKQLNTVVGGVPKSQHMEGKAADITTLHDKADADLFKFIVDKIDFDQCIRYKTFIHISYNGKDNRNQVIDKIYKETYNTLKPNTLK